ncbi:uncharacterized protein TNCV_1965531 [Trichonephila clavipes]|nr:uncharacterized protein TNCV_1965531 [Trichonephila clavipes]
MRVWKQWTDEHRRNRKTGEQLGKLVNNSKNGTMEDQHIQLLPWPAYSPDMSLIEHVWDLVAQRLARDACTAASKDELFAAHTSIMEFSSTSRHSKSV